MPTVDPVGSVPVPAPVPMPSPTPLPVPTPGVVTSEFWLELLNKALIIAAIVIPMFLPTLDHNTFIYQALSIAMIVLGQLGYAKFRTDLKRAQIKAQSDVAVGYMHAQQAQYLAQAEVTRLQALQYRG
jgi:hypothetical protein